MERQKLRVGLGQIGLFEERKEGENPFFFLQGGCASLVTATQRIYERNRNFKYCLHIPAENNPYELVLTVIYSLRLAEIFCPQEERKVTLSHWEARKKDFIRSFGEQALREYVESKPEAKDFQKVEEMKELLPIASALAQGCGFNVVILGISGSSHPIQEVDPFDFVRQRT